MMDGSSQIAELMEVVGSDGRHVGRVDQVMDVAIELARFDRESSGKRHLIPLSWIDYVDDKVHLNLDHDQTKQRWIEQ
jgi:hypothetical protein